MVYLESFNLASGPREDAFLSGCAETKMTCYASYYPFGLFPPREFERLDFDAVTLLYGGNGSGKSTILNAVAQKLGIARETPANASAVFDRYVELCGFSLSPRCGHALPEKSAIITSDDVFDYLLNIRQINAGIDEKREDLFEQYASEKYAHFTMRSLDDYEALKRRNDAVRRTKSRYTNDRLPQNVRELSNGESAFKYFTEKIDRDALYLLDEPENSLSLKLQLELATHIEAAARFYNCQFVIATHAPALLALRGAKIYDLDARPVAAKRWTELENVRLLYDFFKSRAAQFEA